MEQKRKTAVGIPYDEFHKVWESKFDQVELSVSGGELEGITRTNTGVRTRKLNESRMLLDVMEDALGVSIQELFIRSGIVWCIPK